MQATLAQALDGLHFLGSAAPHRFQRVEAGMIHRRRQRHGRGQERLHLVGAVAVLLEPQREVHHVLIRRARMRRDEIRDQVIFLAGLFRGGVEHLLEAVVGADARLHHLVERAALGVLGRDLEIAADVMRDELLDVFGALHRDCRKRQDVKQHPERLRPKLETADQRDAVGHQRNDHHRAEQIAERQRQAETQFQRVGEDHRFDGEEDEGEEDELMMGLGEGRKLREYTEKVGNDWDKNSQKTDGDDAGAGTGEKQSKPSSTKSPVSSGKGKPTTGATAGNILGDSATGKGKNTGDRPDSLNKGIAQVSGEKLAAGMQNVDGKKSGVKTLAKQGSGYPGNNKKAGPIGSGSGDKAGQTSVHNTPSPLTGAPNRNS